jgi:hypothetical protein
VALLADLGILREITGQRRDRLFLAQEVLDTINEEIGEADLID